MSGKEKSRERRVSDSSERASHRHLDIRCRSPMYLVNYLEKYYTEAVNRGKHFSRSNLNDARDISLLKTTQWFLMEIRMGLFRGTGRVRPHVFLLFTFTFKALQDQALVLFPTSSPPHSYSQHSKGRSHLPAPWTFLHSLFLMPGRLFPIDLYRMDSLLLLRSQL